ncbi:hypothetical protein IWZ00DRAFT_252799 [Phyllosticta capitalensis]|uniref:uncharacterized protein n=1 Tax=Phyllosticta capitalensis TaxID=121624 RepID=UPI00312D50D2
MMVHMPQRENRHATPCPDCREMFISIFATTGSVAVVVGLLVAVKDQVVARFPSCGDAINLHAALRVRFRSGQRSQASPGSSSESRTSLQYGREGERWRRRHAPQGGRGWVAGCFPEVESRSKIQSHPGVAGTKAFVLHERAPKTRQRGSFFL